MNFGYWRNVTPQIKDARYKATARLLALAVVVTLAIAVPVAVNAAGVAAFKTIYSFAGAQSNQPVGHLVQTTDGAIYGVSLGSIGHAPDFGSLYKIDKNDGFATVHVFADAGECPSDIALGANGTIYGVTEYASDSATPSGIVFSYVPSTSAYSVLYKFEPSAATGSPAKSIIVGSDGRLYGTSAVGGANGAGYVWSMDSTGDNFAVIHRFDWNDGAQPSGLAEGPDGVLYGGALDGALGGGVVYGVDKSGANFKPVYSWNASQSSSIGEDPQSPIFGADGLLYGVCVDGGADSRGVAFKLTTSGTLTILRSFKGVSEGTHPVSVVFGQDGNLYGNALGGSQGNGLVFELSPDGTSETVIHSFDGADGNSPRSPLLSTVNGSLFGATATGGIADSGTIFAIIPPAESVETASVLLANTAPAAPSISSISPATVNPGSPTFPLTVNGANFLSGDTVDWGTTVLTTTFASSSVLTAQVPASLVTTAGTVTITVVAPASGSNAAQTSNGATLTIGAVSPPTIISLSPSSVLAGSGPIPSLQITGTNFDTTDQVYWNGSQLVTTFVSVTELQASVPGSLTGSAENVPITVSSITSGTSGAATFIVAATSTPTLTSVSPVTALASPTPLTLTVTGTNFINSTVVDWNSVPLVTVLVSPTELLATVPANLASVVGVAEVTVVSPGPLTGGPASFTITGPVITVTAPSLTAPATTTPPFDVPAGTSGISIVVQGSNFQSTTEITWDGIQLQTTLASANEITAFIPASFLANPTPASAPHQIEAVFAGGIVSQPVSFAVVASSSTVYHTFGQGLQMISAPYDFTGVPLTSILSGQSTTNPSIWNPVNANLAIWDPVNNIYDLTLPTPVGLADTLHLGYGYWVRFATTTDLILGEPQTTAQSEGIVTVALSKGWNMIGDPFIVSVPISSLVVFSSSTPNTSLANADTDGIVSSTLYSYDEIANEYVTRTTTGDTLDPYVGYWIYSAQPVYLQISLTSSGTGTPPTAPLARKG